MQFRIVYTTTYSNKNQMAEEEFQKLCPDMRQLFQWIMFSLFKKENDLDR